jgi:hypothetical protein
MAQDKEEMTSRRRRSFSNLVRIGDILCWPRDRTDGNAFGSGISVFSERTDEGHATLTATLRARDSCNSTQDTQNVQRL